MTGLILSSPIVHLLQTVLADHPSPVLMENI